MKEYEKYTTFPNSVLMKVIESQYKDEFKEGFYVDEILKGKSDWIIRWRRNLKSNPQ